MDYYQIIAERFQGTIERIALSVDQLAGPVAQASEMMTQVMLRDGRLFCCGSGPDAALCQLFCASLLSRLEHERPALPAFCLGADSASLTAIASQDGSAECYSRQLRALGQSGDLLLLIASGSADASLSAALAAAREREMLVVVIAASADPGLAPLLNSGDTLISIGADNRPQGLEITTMCLHSLCQLIEYSLFGGQHQE